MHIELRLPALSTIQLQCRDYDDELDNILSILTDICEAIEGQAEFVFSGFGQGRWPIDGGVEPVILLEQLPRVLMEIVQGRASEIQFYEQGFQRTIEFEPVDDHYVATCRSYMTWQPDPAIEQLSRGALIVMLSDVIVEFMRLLRACAPDLAEHPWVTSWLRGTSGY